ncbi:putative manganese-dependent inorganic diphosphatase [Dielma fastidiosa]|uniref:putative manganese-dependent inorganic diphosphatase n=1 Tax=Dielma fastidiosa TaxID=1034346 RepID=UPI000E5290AB|nr:putative manganese-dependent inorganic diphosphatase [Dielma fastidiosa]RHN01380.1 putative manganese-dependent inorganic diphosphatase [Dielma fastidiosa]
MKNNLYITGHKNPDTDSICSSIAYADLKRQLGIDAIASRNGDINAETAFVLKKFNVPQPIYMNTATCSLRDIEIDEVILVKPSYTIKQAWNSIAGTKNKSLFVVDEEEKLMGVVTMSNLSNVLMKECVDIRKLMAETSVQNIVDTLEGTLVNDSENYKSNGQVHILVNSEYLNTDIDFRTSTVVLGNDINLQRRVIEGGATCLVLVEDNMVLPEIAQLAKENDCALIQTSLSTIYVARLIYQSSPIHLIMTKNPVSFKISDMVDEVSKRMSKSRYRSYPILDDDRHVLGAVSRFHLFNYRKKQIVLVDHNEMSQSLENIHDADIVEIIDHHRIGDIETLNPINFRNQTLGSTSTIIAMIYKEKNIVPTRTMAALMCCAIISDTMNFNSPTTTDVDRQIGEELARIARLDLDDLSREMFEAVATLKGKTFSEILYNDFKEYNMDGHKVAIGQINIVDSLELEVLRREFESYMGKINSINNYDILLMVFTNVDGSGSYFVSLGKLAWVVKEAFRQYYGDHDFVKSIISRKKQIVPHLQDELKVI